ncbi:hypothetical protein D3C86_1698420 [compost metagenome]
MDGAKLKIPLAEQADGFRYRFIFASEIIMSVAIQVRQARVVYTNAFSVGPVNTPTSYKRLAFEGGNPVVEILSKEGENVIKYKIVVFCFELSVICTKAIVKKLISNGLNPEFLIELAIF